MRILGVDPGSRLTGYGCVDRVGSRVSYVAHGTLRLLDSRGSEGDSTSQEDRLLLLHQKLSAIIQEFKPKIMVIEKIFFAKNAISALKLGQVRGAVMLTGKIHQMNLCEYSPNEVKQRIAGYGHASKEQIAHMVQLLVGKRVFETLDASDALALALSHGLALGSEQALKSIPTQRKKRKLSLAESVGLKKI